MIQTVTFIIGALFFFAFIICIGLMLYDGIYHFSIYLRCRKVIKNIHEGDVYKMECWIDEDNPFKRHVETHTITILEIRENYARYDFETSEYIGEYGEKMSYTKVTRCESLKKLMYEHQLYLFKKVYHNE